MAVTHKDLFTLVKEQIDKRVEYRGTDEYKNQMSRTFSLSTSGSRIDISVSELVDAVQTILNEALPSRIISGLTVIAQDLEDDTVTVAAGKGTVGGNVYTVEEDTIVTIPFDNSSTIFFVTLYNNTIMIDKVEDSKKLTLAKIIVPAPGITAVIKDQNDNSFDAYIIQFQEYKLYGDANGKFEENTVELLRDNIEEVLAENLIGNIRLNENLKIINTAGTIELNSDSLKLYNSDGDMLSKFNRDGVFLYDTNGVELAKFTGSEARIGNIKILTSSIQSENFVAGSHGFRIQDNGDVEFSSGTFRGTLSAPMGNIGGFTITDVMLYGGVIQTGLNVGVGENGVVMDTNGLRVYDSVLGLVVNLPSDGSAPTFSNGSINETTFEISTNAILRTSSTVGDGSINSAGILINSTGIYGCGTSQLLQDANFKILANGNAYFNGEIRSVSGVIGGVTINETGLYGGLIEGALIRAPIIESSLSYPKIRLDEHGLYYQSSNSTGQYGTFLYGDGTVYGAGTLAYLFNTEYPVLSIEAEYNLADLHLYNRLSDPVSGNGPHRLGDIICVDGNLKICKTIGSPGLFDVIVQSTGNIGGSGSAGVGKQYVELNIGGVIYKLLHDGTI